MLYQSLASIRFSQLPSAGLMALLLCMLVPLGATDPQPDNPGGGTGTTYYVDPADGNNTSNGLAEASAWRTLTYAISQVSAGDTVLLRGGDYDEPEPDEYKNWQITIAGSPGQYITFRAYPGETPRLHVDTWNGVQMEGNAAYIELDGLEVIGRADPASIIGDPVQSDDRLAVAGDRRYFGRGISVQGNAHHIRIRNCTIHRVGSNGIAALANLLLIEGCHIYNTSHRSDAGDSGMSVGIGSAGPAPQNYGMVIRNNVIHDVENMLYFKDYKKEIPPGSGNWVPWTITDGNGIIFDLTNNNGRKALVCNNLIYNCGGRGLHAFHSANIDFVNNTLYHNLTSGRHAGDAGGTMRAEGELSSIGSNSSVNFTNNIAFAADAYKPWNYNNSGTSYQNNLVFGTVSGGGLLDGSNLTGVNPLFVNAGINPATADFRLANGSPAVDAGQTVAVVAEDFLGAARPQGAAYDIGAYEKTDTGGPTMYALSVVSGSGDGVYAAGTEVLVTADAPAPDFVFVGWSGHIAGLADAFAATTTLTMPAASIVIEATYDAVPIPPVTPSPIAAGVVYNYYHGAYSSVDDLDAAPALATGFQNDFSIASNRQRDDNFGFIFNGYIEVPSTGTYTFSTTSDDGSTLRIAGRLVVDNDGAHAAATVSGVIGLQAGLHPIEVRYFELAGDQVLDVTWQGPGGVAAPVPAVVLFRDAPELAVERRVNMVVDAQIPQWYVYAPLDASVGAPSAGTQSIVLSSHQDLQVGSQDPSIVTDN